MIPLTYPYAEIINRTCDTFILPHELVLAICQVESACNTWATRYEPNWKYFVTPDKFARANGISEATETIHQATSFGVMQIMGGRARELGHNLELVRLLSPEVGIRYGCLHLASCFKRFGQDAHDAVAAYNAGSPRKLPTGQYENQGYVDKVMEAYNHILFQQAQL